MATKRERTRESIIKESCTLFAGKGFKQVTMKDVCEITGMSRGSFLNSERMKRGRELIRRVI